MRQKTPPGRLACQECPREDKAGRGWKAYIADVFEVLVYCPECAEREFGETWSEFGPDLADSFDPE
jgi:hypothetical protein